MSRFPEELKVIPWGAWVIAICIGLGFTLMLQLVALPRDAKLSLWPGAWQLCFSVSMGLILFIYALLIGYVNGDAQRRGMRHVMWTLLCVFIPNGIGIILFFILRDPLPKLCPKCGGVVRTGPFCPSCGAALANTCRACGHSVEPGWSHCTGCGANLRKSSIETK